MSGPLEPLIGSMSESGQSHRFHDVCSMSAPTPTAAQKRTFRIGSDVPTPVVSRIQQRASSLDRLGSELNSLAAMEQQGSHIIELEQRTGNGPLSPVKTGSHPEGRRAPHAVG